MNYFLIVCSFSTIFFIFSNAASFSYPIERSGSLIQRLLKSGKYSEFLKSRNELKTGSQPFIDFYDDYYILKVDVGTPAQSFRLSLDTASSFLWVLDINCISKDCHGASNHGQKSTYNFSDSSTFIEGAGIFVAQFDGQSISGYLGKETVSFGGLTLKNQDFGSAQLLPQLYVEQPIDGVIGFGFPAMAVNGTRTPLDGLMPMLDQQMFSVWMDRKIVTSRGGPGGLVTFGAMDTVNCFADVNWVPLTVKSYWGFDLDGFKIGSYERTKKEKVISDTGSGWIGAPPTVISAIVKATGAKYDWNLELYVVPCSTMKTQPDIKLTINGIEYTIPSVEYILDLLLDNGQCALTFFGFGATGFGPTWVLGDTFIRSYCHFYDYGNMRIGLAKAHHSY
ncbi:hypothetical protein B9Z55_017256 [Caenorhabditis nigoni]|uniref:Peptidase A1 domain-containing protein n=1 Tax=Caenorhabditis nigoni TaxID=1611254 RepID=A0A2G5T8P2_9PELO|nr:hypothetical protein B9Z55_017256 [Caenorhabditis nigoni]